MASIGKMALLLDTVKRNLGIDRLLSEGLTYSQVASVLSEARRKGYLEIADGSTQLSPEGKEYLREVSKKFGRISRMGQSPEYVSIRKPIGPDVVFLPEERDVIFGT